MTMKIADDAQSIKARMEEIQRERMQAIMGRPIEEPQSVEMPADADYNGVYGYNAFYNYVAQKMKGPVT